MEESPEYMTLKKLQSKLRLGFRNNMTELAMAFEGKGLIDGTCYAAVSQVPSTLLPAQKADKMFDSVLENVQLSPEKFDEMVKILRRKPIYQPLVKMLEEEYQASGNTLHTDNCLVNFLKSITIEDPQQIKVACHVYNARTNELIQSSRDPITRDIKLLCPPQGLQEFSSDPVRCGTKLRLAITVDSNCYVYILDIGTSGKTSILLPNAYGADNYFTANQTYYFPDKEYELEIEGPSGKETIQVVALSNKLESFDEVAVHGVEEKESYRDMSLKKIKPSMVPSEKKGFAQIQFSVQ